METLLQGLREKMEKETGYKLQETYAYARFIKQEMFYIDTRIVIPVKSLPL